MAPCVTLLIFQYVHFNHNTVLRAGGGRAQTRRLVSLGLHASAARFRRNVSAFFFLLPFDRETAGTLVRNEKKMEDRS